MKLDIDGNQHKLEWSTGRTADVCGGIVGIGDDGEVYSGHDARLHFEDNEMTSAERRELAEFMIERWRRFGQVEG